MKRRIASPLALCAGLVALSPACGSSTHATGSAATGGASSTSTSTAASGAASTSGSSTTGSSGAGTGGAASTGSTSTASSSSGTSGSGGGTTTSTGTGGAALQPFKGVALYEVSTCPDLATLKLSWYYNWTAKTGCSTGIEFVPQIWGHASEPIATEIAAAVAKGQTTILGFNEPDNTSQSNMTVAAAVALWPTLQGQAGIARLGSPATSANAAGQMWFEQFMTQVKSQHLRVDFIALHWYGWNSGSCNDASTLESYIKWAEQWNLPLWITEFGCMNMSDPTAATVKTFYDDVLVMFKKHPLLERYAWYLSRSSDNNALISSSTVMLTPLGTDYAAAPAEH
jgi:hypothetical protein